MTCAIEISTAIHCEAEPTSASELLDVLRGGNEVLIKNETYNFAEITDLLNNDEIVEAAEISLTENRNAVVELYVKKLAEMME